MGRLRIRSPIAIGLVFITLSIVVAFPTLFARDVYREWRGGHISLFQYFPPMDWLGYRVNLLLNRGYAELFGSDDAGLPAVRLYISEQSINALQADIPSSVKSWQQGKMIYPDGRLQNIKARHRGDNPFNWLLAKQSWRIKTTKKNTLDNVRVFNYVAPQDAVIVDTFYYSWLARRLGLPAARSRLVEMYINNRYRGVFTEVEQLDESYLRNSGFMPVNIYKGEQRMSERRYGMDFDLYANPALWTKTAAGNYTVSVGEKNAAKSDLDLRLFLDLIRAAETSADDFDRLMRVAPFNIWAKFAAYETLNQHSYDALHNNRLLLDIWKGTANPVVHDPQAVVIDTPEDVKIDQPGSRIAILRLYHQDSEFQVAKLRHLWGFLKDKVVRSAITDFEKYYPPLEASLSRDPYIFVTRLGEFYNGFDYRSRFEAFKRSNEMIQTELRARLSKHPASAYEISGYKMSLDVGGLAPLSNVTLGFPDGANLPDRIVWDRNNNKIIDNDDPVLALVRDGNNIEIEADFMANWVAEISPEIQRAENYGYHARYVPARFHLLADQSLEGSTVSARNGLTDEPFTINPGRLNSVVPSRLNKPVENQAQNKAEIWSGTIEIIEDRIVKSPVIIKPGTTIRLGEQNSIVFRGKVIAEGTPGEPIVFEPLNDGVPWGAIALVGAGANGSRLGHVKFRDGGGDAIDMLRLTAMLSIHDAVDIRIHNATLRTNRREDDMVHVVYSKDVIIEDSKLLSARSDAIDIDLSDVVLRNLIITNAGNDGIDLMTSKALISNVRIEKSGDKGISVGEKSDVTIIDSTLRGNQIGVQSKDDSMARIVHSALLDNATDLNAYWKNWRYGRGGRILVDKSIFQARRQTAAIDAKKGSGIRVRDSVFSFAKRNDKRVAYDGVSEQSDNLKSSLIGYDPEIARTLTRNNLAHSPELRGPR